MGCQGNAVTRNSANYVYSRMEGSSPSRPTQTERKIEMGTKEQIEEAQDHLNVVREIVEYIENHEEFVYDYVAPIDRIGAYIRLIEVELNLLEQVTVKKVKSERRNDQD